MVAPWALVVVVVDHALGAAPITGRLAGVMSALGVSAARRNVLIASQRSGSAFRSRTSSS